MERFRKFCCVIVLLFLIYCCFFYKTKNVLADVNFNGTDQEIEIKRSLESLRDLDYQTWQLIVYPISNSSKTLILRIVGYPGSLRMDHPSDLLVSSGRKNWYLQDITMRSKAHIGVLNDSAAEFDLSPLIADLDKNRPLRLILPGLINELPIPPYLVGEWRTLINKT
tara:strand:- start:1230 stop:1730 length:501 start_codon:yes stop_codon:yes gene_type:complete